MIKKINKNQLGFTLLEILIALFIFAIIATITTIGLFTVLDAKKDTAKHDRALAQLQTTMILLQRDMSQLINRPVLNQKNSLQMAIVGSSAELTFTRTGFANPLSTELRSDMQRVTYRLNNNKLIRTNWNTLDRAPGDKQTSQILMDNITELKFSYYTKKNKIQSAWSSELQTPYAYPKLIKVTIGTKDFGEIHRFFPITVGALYHQ